jgi:hypothetical protein
MVEVVLDAEDDAACPVRSVCVAIAILCGLLLGIVVYLAQSTYFRRKDQDKYALVRRFERFFTRKNQ